MSQPHPSDYRTLIHTSAITATALNILSGLVKMKVAAVLLGLAGVGMIGTYHNLVRTTSTLSGFGVETIGTRQIAAAKTAKDIAGLIRTRQALLWGSLGLTVTAAVAALLVDP